MVNVETLGVVRGKVVSGQWPVLGESVVVTLWVWSWSGKLSHARGLGEPRIFLSGDGLEEIGYEVEG